MRFDPTEDTLHAEQIQRRYQRRVDRVTRIVALVVAGLSTFTFILKIVFF
ncbi:MAG: hypothetical protein ABIN95_11960 [Mucilaginibacter sp.]